MHMPLPRGPGATMKFLVGLVMGNLGRDYNTQPKGNYIGGSGYALKNTMPSAVTQTDLSGFRYPRSSQK